MAHNSPISLRNVVNAPTSWQHLRHDRERRVAQDHFWEGWASAMQFIEDRVGDLMAIGPDARQVYFDIVDAGLADSLPTQVRCLIERLDRVEHESRSTSEAI